MKTSLFAFCLIVIMIGTACRLDADTHYVDSANATPQSPFTNGWASAAVNIQDAIDQASSNDVVLVTNGVYDAGGKAGLPNAATTNRVTVTNYVTVIAVSTNPSDTLIVGKPDTTGGPPTNGPSAVRCAYVGTGCLLAGFTLTNGYAGAAEHGGGVYGQSTGSGTVSNCLIVSCDATTGNGGGAYKGLLVDCTIRGCSAGNFYQRGGGGCRYTSAINCSFIDNSATTGGGVYCSGGSFSNCIFEGNTGSYGFNIGGYRTGSTTFYDCRVSGGIYCDYRDIDRLKLKQCVISGYNGGGYPVKGGTLFNCLIVSNTTTGNGLLYNVCLYNCTVVANTTKAGWGALTTASKGCIATNSIVYGNLPANISAGTYAIGYSCIDTAGVACVFTGEGNITDNPKFVSPQTCDYHLTYRSPCVNTGSNMDWMVGAPDLNGTNSRIINFIVDMGAYEYLPPSAGTVIIMW